MARKPASFWRRHRYTFSALVLLLPGWFYYQSLHPVFPAVWPEQQIAQLKVSAMPFDQLPPYLHDGLYVKDFMLMFADADISGIRQAFLNIGPAPLPLQQLQVAELGILHGSRYGQHAHALAAEKIRAGDKLWLVMQDWSGTLHTTSWEIPAQYLAD